MYPNPLDKEANDSQSVWWELGEEFIIGKTILEIG